MWDGVGKGPLGGSHAKRKGSFLMIPAALQQGNTHTIIRLNASVICAVNSLNGAPAAWSGVSHDGNY